MGDPFPSGPGPAVVTQAEKISFKLKALLHPLSNQTFENQVVVLSSQGRACAAPPRRREVSPRVEGVSRASRARRALLRLPPDSRAAQPALINRQGLITIL